MPIQSSHPSHECSMESSARPCAWQVSPALSRSIVASRFNSTSTSFVSFLLSFHGCISITYLKMFVIIKPNTIRTDALTHISQPQAMQLGPSGPPGKQVVEALPPVLVLHLKRFSYDEARTV